MRPTFDLSPLPPDRWPPSGPFGGPRRLVGVDARGFLMVLAADAFWKAVRIHYSPIGLDGEQTE
ncbi:MULTISPECIES: hypothetical protein [unclassified Thiocapsa]|uniref:hypothetical protein n=1 Tax=unclassified Thiocapsa TaxID=2641286 RepID=UPI0035B3AA0F